MVVAAALALAMAAGTAQAFFLHPSTRVVGPLTSGASLQQRAQQAQQSQQRARRGLVCAKQDGGFDDEDEDVRFSMGSKHIDTGFLKVRTGPGAWMRASTGLTDKGTDPNHACGAKSTWYSARRRRRCGRTRSS